ncbi:PIN domain-containing protein [Natronorubrum sp. DTA7]|uniref:PIN domain-containing protein n=1 Tax=Natronorubrum sp. DTA7 TaxID=3447016 RepID=UPI003F862C3F
MTDAYVFDTEAIIAYFYDEPGRPTVESLLTAVDSDRANGYLTGLNAAEVFYLVARFEGVDETPTVASRRTADRDLRALERAGVSIERADWRLIGDIKADGQISLADAAAVALASERDATLVIGGDDDFDDLPLDVTIRRFRDDGV